MPLPRKFRQIALEAERKQGFFRNLRRQFVTYVPSGDHLVVSFDNMNSREEPVPRKPWGAGFVARQGFSHLGVMMKRRCDWFRHADLFDFFDEMRDSGFFCQFRRVTFYGSSMGGYGALAFAAAAPGSSVVAFTPQTTLNPQLVPWEKRYERGRLRGDWQDPRYADAAATLSALGEVLIFHDPYFAPDAAHVERLSGPNVRHFRSPFTGHKVMRHLKLWGILEPVTVGAISGTLTQAEFIRLSRVRRSRQAYLRRIAQLSNEARKPDRARKVLGWASSQNPEWNFPRIQNPHFPSSSVICLR